MTLLSKPPMHPQKICGLCLRSYIQLGDVSGMTIIGFEASARQLASSCLCYRCPQERHYENHFHQSIHFYSLVSSSALWYIVCATCSTIRSAPHCRIPS